MAEAYKLCGKSVKMLSSCSRCSWCPWSADFAADHLCASRYLFIYHGDKYLFRNRETRWQAYFRWHFLWLFLFFCWSPQLFGLDRRRRGQPACLRGPDFDSLWRRRYSIACCQVHWDVTFSAFCYRLFIQNYIPNRNHKDPRLTANAIVKWLWKSWINIEEINAARNFVTAMMGEILSLGSREYLCEMCATNRCCPIIN